MKKVYETPVMEVNSCDCFRMIAESLPIVDNGIEITDENDILTRENNDWDLSIWSNDED